MKRVRGGSRASWLATTVAFVALIGAALWSDPPVDDGESHAPRSPDEAIERSPQDHPASQASTGLSPDRDLVIEGVEPGPGGFRVHGYLRGSEPTTVAVTVGAERVDAVASQPRFDLDAVSVGTHFGFEATISGAAGDVVCAEVGPAVDCAPAGCATDVFSDGFVDRIHAAYPDQRITASVMDTRTGCTYGLQANLPITTASVMKLEVLGAVLLEAQGEGRTLTERELGLAEAMLHLSLNPETAVLWGQVGFAGMTGFSQSVGADHTTHTAVFGATVSTAADRTKVALAVLAGAGPLDWEAVEQAWTMLAGVHPSQQWGISAGVAEGFSVVNKNGFYPLTGSGWRVGSTGFVADPDGGGYAVTIMTDRNPDQAEGVDLVERVGRHIGRRLTWGPVADRPFDDVECVLHSGGETWVGLAARLGLSPGDADAVRRTAGGDGPFRGQLVCTP